MVKHAHEMVHVQAGQDHEQETHLHKLMEVAEVIRSDPRRREMLDRFISGDIHKSPGGAIAIPFGYDWNEEQQCSVPNMKVFWHDHGSFVGKDGAMYNVRTDDNGVGQVYVAPVDERGQYIDCIHPYTYDCYIGPHGIDVRADFINGAHRASPQNTAEERRLQDLEGHDIMVPRHQIGTEFDDRRDSISLRKYGDGHIEGMIHDSVSGETQQLYAPYDVKAALLMLDDMEVELEGLAVAYEAEREIVRARHMGTRAAA